jgi:hypothetical protein
MLTVLCLRKVLPGPAPAVEEHQYEPLSRKSWSRILGVSKKHG